MVTGLNIDRVSPARQALVAQDVGEAPPGHLIHLHPLHGQLDGPVFPLRILQQIFFPVKVTI